MTPPLLYSPSESFLNIFTTAPALKACLCALYNIVRFATYDTMMFTRAYVHTAPSLQYRHCPTSITHTNCVALMDHQDKSTNAMLPIDQINHRDNSLHLSGTPSRLNVTQNLKAWHKISSQALSCLSIHNIIGSAVITFQLTSPDCALGALACKDACPC